MENEIINKYLSFKENNFFNYSKTFYKVYSAESSLWKNEEEYETLIKRIFKTYIDKYYLRSSEDLNELNTNHYDQKEFRLALSLAIISDALKDDYEKFKVNNQTDMYSLVIIVYLIINIDKMVSLKNNVTLKDIISKLQDLLNDAKQEKLMQKNPFLINMLAHLIKDNYDKECKFFKTIESDESYNEFSKYDDNSYYVSYIYNLHKLSDYSSLDVKTVYNKYRVKNSYYPISFELASVTLLKLFASGGKVPYLLLPINSSYLNDKNIKNIDKIFSNVFIRDNIKFSIFYSDYKKNFEKFNLLRDRGYKLVLYMDETEQILDYSNIKIDLVIYVTTKFMGNNEKFTNFVNHENVESHIVDITKYISEKNLIKEMREEI